MRNNILVLSLLLSMLLSACNSVLSSRRCYLVEDGGTTIVLEEDRDPPQVTFITPGQDNRTVLGEIRDQTFVYLDGTELHFDDDKAFFESQTTSEGIMAPSVSCPAKL